MKPAATHPVTEGSLACFFKEQLTTHAAHLDPPLQEDTFWYLGNLLERFGQSQQLFSFDQGTRSLRPLALLYRDALEAPNERTRCLLLQQLGDLSLFLGAVFPERYLKRGIRQDYFVGMGGGAYDYLAGNAPGNRHVFAELANAFARMLSLVANACSRALNHSQSDILALYERWMRTGDPIAERTLRRLGIALTRTPGAH